MAAETQWWPSWSWSPAIGAIRANESVAIEVHEVGRTEVACLGSSFKLPRPSPAAVGASMPVDSVKIPIAARCSAATASSCCIAAELATSLLIAEVDGKLGTLALAVLDTCRFCATGASNELRAAIGICTTARA